jgi:alpha-galactosidase
MAEFTEQGSLPSMSFRYGGQDSRDLLPGWPQERTSEECAGGRMEHLVLAEAGGGLQVRVHTRTFDEFAAVDWVVEFENAGRSDTPILEDVLPLDLSVPVEWPERVRLHHAHGSNCAIDDFLPLTTELRRGSRVSLAPCGGRSSDVAFPFMNVQRAGCGMVLAVGWSGQWAAQFSRDEGSVRLTAGMERTHLRLRPGERIRTPRILALLWEGDDPERGTNLLRRLLIAHYLPRVDGELAMPVAAQCLQGWFYGTGQANERQEMTALPRVAEIGAEAYWIDACWFGDRQEWWANVGSWEVNRERFPSGIRPISDAAHERGMRFVLWLEPERVRRDSTIAREHPEFLLAHEGDPDNLLLNLGMPEARQYVTELVSACIEEHGMDVYRQDANLYLLPYWRAADPADRVGMTEIRHVEGLYALWDDLLRRHHGLVIDNCASGGRRVDIETLSRALCFWPSDFMDACGLPYGMDLHVGDQCAHAGLARWVPLFGGGIWNFTPYSSRAATMGGFTFGVSVERSQYADGDGPAAVHEGEVLRRGTTLLGEGFPVAEARAAIREMQELRPLVLGDFHLLLPLTVSAHDWCAWQLHRADLDRGFALFFRRHRSPFPAMDAGLKDLDPAGRYEVSLAPDYGRPAPAVVSGAEAAGSRIEIATAPGSMLLRYARVP